MKNATERGRLFTSILRRESYGSRVEFPAQDDPIAVLIQSVLLWNASSQAAVKAYGKIMERVVDYNELRVTMPGELTGWIGSTYPGVEDRFRHLRAILRGIYNREHDICLASLSGLGKREIAGYFDTLNGMIPFVSARVLLLCFDVHRIPVDSFLKGWLVREEVVSLAQSETEITTWLSRQVKAAEGVEAHHILQSWIDDAGAPPAGPGVEEDEASSRKTPARKEAAKSPSKSKAKGRKRTRS